ncbi:tetratricopeptide repeat protein [Agaribacter flavus]|uniref:Tetratricopeptide repeat protein n=1 Tax=Agaribacter flavus TaxID=1902781 RepID=A0ABV7FMN9_9ALTE
MRNVIVFISALLLLSACSSTSFLSKNKPELKQEAFPSYSSYTVESPEEIFHLSQEAIDFVEFVTQSETDDLGRMSALVFAIFDHAGLNLGYTADANTIASETFYNGAANCLSLTVMAYSMAEYLGIDARFQDVQIPEFWTFRQGASIINRHINLRVKMPTRRLGPLAKNGDLIVDFDPSRNAKEFSSVELNRRQIVSYFYNNKGAEYLINDERDKAFAYYKAAIEADPSNEGAWLNLGVLYSRSGYLDEAEEAYKHALSLKSNYLSALENLAAIYAKTQREDESNSIDARLHKKRLKNPYYHSMLAEYALLENRPQDAISHFKKAIALNNRAHEFFFGLAKAYYAVGDVERSSDALIKARKRSNNRRVSEQYSKKLSLLAYRG